MSRCLAVLALLSLGACAGQGGKVFVREGCVNCHRFKGRGGGPGPALDGVGSRLDGTAIRAQISNPGVNPASRMPSFDHLSWFELRSLVAFLRS